MNTVAGQRIVVVGAGIAGAAATQVLRQRGVAVTVLEQRASPATAQLEVQGARVVIAELPPPGLLDDASEVVVSPGIPPHHPVVTAASAAGLEVYSEPELAWRLRRPGAAPWLAVTGSNGKTTTVTMLAAILRAAGLRAAALGNIGEPLVTDAATDYDVLAVELSSQQLHWSRLLAPQVAAILNLAEDHLEWHGDLAAYGAAKAAIWRGAGTAGDTIAVGNLDDDWVADRLSRLSARTVGFTLHEPQPGQLGVVDGYLVDRAFDRRPGAGTRLASAADIRPAGRHNVANAVAAAAMARAYGVPADAVARGLAEYQPQPHRSAVVATVRGVTYVDDSKATNPHAALGTLTAYPRIVWIAGGQLKGVAVDELVAQVAGRLAAVVLLGVDRAQLAAALARHAPHIPVVEVGSTDDGAMREVVQAAAGMARPGDAVVMAPAAASKDMFASFAHRGEAFAAAVHALTGPGVRS